MFIKRRLNEGNGGFIWPTAFDVLRNAETILSRGRGNNANMSFYSRRSATTATPLLDSALTTRPTLLLTLLSKLDPLSAPES